MKKLFACLLVFGLSFWATAQHKNTPVMAEAVSYKSADGATLKGYVAVNKNIKGKRPAIVVIPEWWGCNYYARRRAQMLADLGYIALAADMYGDGKQGPTPQEAGALATPFYKDPKLAKTRIEAAVAFLKSYAETDVANMACIGYCFGGTMSLNAANLGMDFKGVVSFHGGLAVVPAQAGKTKAKILVCHGAADQFISSEELQNFRSNLDATQTGYQFISYPDATHAFSNPDATANGLKFNIPIAYNEAADKKSWDDMKSFLAGIFK
jgi:dienelactone hydrolase